MSRLPFVLLALALLAPAAGATGGDDCMTTGDASDASASAVAVTIPLARCAGQLDAASDVDYYSLSLPAGATVWLAAERVNDGDYAALLLDPAGHDFLLAHAGGAAQATTTSAGTYLLKLHQARWAFPAAYAITITTREQDASGSNLLFSPAGLVPARGVNEALGPSTGPDGVDGSWLDLASPGTGHEVVDVGGNPSAPRVWFYDARGAFLGGGCGSSFASGLCLVPAGAARVLVTEDAPPLGGAWDLAYHY